MNMKLTEFSLWAFTLELDLARKFTLFSRCVCAHFERLFDPIETDGIYRVVVKLCGPDEKVGTTELSSSVIKYYKEFDLDYFEGLNIVAKKGFFWMRYTIHLCHCVIWKDGRRAPFMKRTRWLFEKILSIYTQ